MPKVLHVLRQLEPGGIECWLLRLIETWPAATRPEFHFALESTYPGSLAPAFQHLGARLHHCPSPRNLPLFAARFLQLLRQEGPFQAVHCHTHHASAFVLSLAACAAVPLRIAHSHANSNFVPASPLRHAYQHVSRLVLSTVANHKLAVSQAAAHDLFGPRHPGQALPCGLDWNRYLQPRPAAPAGRFNLVHVGRLAPEKNHAFLFRVFAGIAARSPEAQLFLVGDGPLRASLEQQAVALGLAPRIHFLGQRQDIPEILAETDLFVFPSHHEGLGIAAIEAQAAGVPVLCATHLPPEITIIPALVQRLALELPIQQWVNTAMSMRTATAPSLQARAIQLESSGLALSKNIQQLEALYYAHA
ncbi:MAG: glycosyltransferase [Bryobacter sp.]|nr:glycosyltransferase [Bryobacter sp.]